MTQLESTTPDLFAAPSRTPAMPEGVPVEVCGLFESLAFKVREAGLLRYSARALLHQIRWHHRVERGDAAFKINNNHSAPLARWFMARHPELPDFFETRDPGE